MTSKKDKLRPCEFFGKSGPTSGYFHRWEKVEVIGPDGAVQVMRGICEDDNGEIHLSKPEDVRFTDRITPPAYRKL